MAVRRLILAIGFMTRLPVPRIDADDRDFAAAIRLYPIVGLIIGAVVTAAGLAGAWLDPWIGALAATVAWVWVTGALHLDGLGDLADGLGAAHGDRARMLAVMADPHIGSFGVVAIVLQLAAKIILLHAVLLGDWLALLAIPAIARIGPLVWARWLQPFKAGGLGAAIAQGVRPRDAIGWLLLVLACAAIRPGLLAGPLLIAVLYLFFRQKIGGMTGDAHGAGIELVESGLLLVVAALIAR